MWGESVGPAAGEALLSLADELGLAGREGAGLLQLPSVANGRGLREVGVLPFSGPGYSPVGEPGWSAGEMPDAGHTAYYLYETDPVRDQGDRAAWERALHRAGLVVAHASVLTEGLREHANVIFPADTYAEKDGTVVHPDGRLQRLRTAIAHPGTVRAGWWVVGELARRLDLDTGVLTSPMAFAQVVDAVPFYGGLTLEEIGGRGVRWPEREQASAFPGGRPPLLTADVGDNSDIDREIAQDGAQKMMHPNPVPHRLVAEPMGRAPMAAVCAWVSTSRSGPRPRSRSRRRSSTRSPPRRPSSRPRTPRGSGSARATRSRSRRTGPA